MEVFRFDFTLKKPIASDGTKLNSIEEYIPVFFGEPAEQKTIGIDKGNNEVEEFAVFTEGAFTTNTKDTISWEFFSERINIQALISVQVGIKGFLTNVAFH